MKENIKVEKLRRSDIGEASKLFREVIRGLEYYTAKEIKESIRGHSIKKLKFLIKERDRVFRVAKIDGRVVGIIECYLPPTVKTYLPPNNMPLCWITWVIVNKEYRHRHIGSLLIGSLENGSDIRWQRIQGNVRIGNSASNSMFRKLRYKKVETTMSQPKKTSRYRWEKLLQPNHKRN